MCPNFRFGDFELEEKRFQLLRRGRPIDVEPRVFELITYLVNHRDRLVTKQELFEELWQGKHVTDAALTRCVSAARRVLEDQSEPQMIQTVHGRGYRFSAPVAVQDTDVAVPTTLDLPPATPENQAGARIGNRIGPYQLVKLLGKGGMGVVYQAVDERLNRLVALKLLPPEFAADSVSKLRFLREARAASALDHPRICTIYQIDETDDGHLFLAMAYYEGQTLDARIAQGTISVREAVEFAIGIGEGLAAAHDQQIVHRDIKPRNILVTDSESVKILDFGIAKQPGALELTVPGAAVGTTPYMSPEQVRALEVDRRSDVWALGVVLYESLTGRTPFRRPTKEATIAAILSDDPEPLAGELPGQPLLQVVIDRALAKDVARRYADVPTMVEDLKTVLDSITDSSLRSSARLALRTVVRKPRWRARLLAGTAAAAAALAGISYLGSIWRPEWSLGSEARKLHAQAESYVERGDLRTNLENAEELFRKALALEPESAFLIGSLAELLARRHRQQPTDERARETRSLSDRALSLDAGQTEAWLAKARLALTEDALGDAQSYARRALSSSPKDCRGHAVLGEVLVAAGEVAQGMGELERGASERDGHLWCRLRYARLLWDQGRKPEATLLFQDILRYRPDQTNALTNLALLYIEQSEPAEAVPLLKRLKRHSPDSFFADQTLGVAYYALRNFDKAIDHYERAAASRPEHPSPPFNLGEAYEELFDQRQAHRWYEVALANYDARLATGAAPVNTLARRALTAAKLGRFDEAFDNLRKAETRHPQHAELPFRAAQVYALAGDRERLFEWIDKTVAVKRWSRSELLADLCFRPYQNDAEFLARLDPDFEPTAGDEPTAAAAQRRPHSEAGS